MRIRDLAFLGGAVGTAMLAYGALVEARRLTVERRTLALPHWPERLRGYRIAVLADLHIHNARSSDLAREAVALALDQAPDMVVLPGDIVSAWTPDIPRRVGEILEPLLLMDGNVVATPGNHDYDGGGNPELLRLILGELNIKMLRNEQWRHGGITWIGLDSYNEGKADVRAAFYGQTLDPIISIWHEPDLVHMLPRGVVLQISGHTHGGQFILPGGYAPMHTDNGELYVRGFFPDAPTPLYVSRGIGTTFIPARFLCPPEVSLLTLVPRTPVPNRVQ